MPLVIALKFYMEFQGSILGLLFFKAYIYDILFDIIEYDNEVMPTIIPRIILILV